MQIFVHASWLVSLDIPAGTIYRYLRAPTTRSIRLSTSRSFVNIFDVIDFLSNYIEARAKKISQRPADDQGIDAALKTIENAKGALDTLTAIVSSDIVIISYAYHVDDILAFNKRVIQSGDADLVMQSLQIEQQPQKENDLLPGGMPAINLCLLLAEGVEAGDVEKLASEIGLSPDQMEKMIANCQERCGDSCKDVLNSSPHCTRERIIECLQDTSLAQSDHFLRDRSVDFIVFSGVVKTLFPKADINKLSQKRRHQSIFADAMFENN